MHTFKIFPAVLVLTMVVVLAACTASQPVDTLMSDADGMSNEMPSDMPDNKAEAMPGEMMENSTSNNGMGAENAAMADSAQHTGEESQPAAEEMESEAAAAPTWVDHVFTDAVTGETFSISGYKGKVVLVETMAMWCSNCLKQQNQVKELYSLLGDREDFIGIGIDVDPNEEISMLAAYVEKYGFDWRYSVAPPEVLAGIQSELGGQFLNPPSTPIVLFDKDGQPHPLPFGIKSANELLGFVEQFLN